MKLFDRVADAPDALPRLRSVVLDLAFRGRLLPRERTPRTATVLPYTVVTMPVRHAPAETLPFHIPSTWRWQPFESVATIETNLVNPRKHRDLPHIAPDNIVSRTGRLLPYETVGTSGVVSAKHLFGPGQILYSKIRPALAKAVAVDFVGLCSADMYPVRPKIDRQYLLRFMLSEGFVSQTTEVANRVAMPKINQDALNRVLVPVPSDLEQQRIVAKVDELMALCDRLEAAQKEREAARVRFGLSALAGTDTAAGSLAIAVDNFAKLTGDVRVVDELRTAVQRLAVRGKLLPQDPRDEPASHSLASPSASRGRPTEWARDEKTGAPEGTVTPRGWNRVPLAAVLRDLQTGPFGSSLHQSDYRSGGTPVVNPASLRKGRIVPVPKMAVDEATLNRLRTFRLQTGDIVMARRGEMGRCAVVTQIEDGWLCGTGSLVLRLIPGVAPRYLALAIGAPSAREYLTSSAVGITMQNLNQGVLMRMPLLLPPTAEQVRIVAKVDELMALCDQLEAHLEAGDIARSRLLDALIAETLAAPQERSA